MKQLQKIDRYVLCFLAGGIMVLLLELMFYIGQTTAPIQQVISALADI